MRQKFGEEFARNQLDLGRREIGGLWYDGSNIAQPSYPLRGHYGPTKEMESPGLSEPSPSYEELHPVGPSRDDLGRDGPDLDRE